MLSVSNGFKLKWIWITLVLLSHSLENCETFAGYFIYCCLTTPEWLHKVEWTLRDIAKAKRKNKQYQSPLNAYRYIHRRRHAYNLQIVCNWKLFARRVNFINLIWCQNTLYDHVYRKKKHNKHVVRMIEQEYYVRIVNGRLFIFQEDLIQMKI